MADLSKLSDAELMALHQKASTQTALSKLSDDELISLHQKAIQAPTSQAEAAWRGTAQGLSFGAADNIAGGLEALGSKVGVRGLGGSFSDIRWETPEEDKQSFGDVYTEAQQKRLGRDKQASREHPITYGAGLVGGTVLTSALLPGASTVAGQTMQGLAQGAFTTEAKDSNEFIRDVGGSGLLSGSFGAASSLWKGAKAAKNAGEVSKAAAAIGVKPTPGMLYDDVGVKTRESVLYQTQGRIGGVNLRSQIKGNIEAMNEAAEAIVSKASGKTAFESGDAAGQALKQSVAKKLEPAEAIYEGYEKRFRLFKPKTKPIADFISEAKEKFKFSKPAVASLDEFAEAVPQVKNLDDLKRLRTGVGAALSEAKLARNPEQVKALGSLYDKLTEARSDALLTRAKGEGEAFFKGAKQDIENADAIYRGVIKEVETAVLGRGKQVKGGPKATINTFLEKTPEIARINKIIRTNDPKQIAAVKAAYPKAFKILRQAKVQEIVERSQTSGTLDPRKLAATIHKLPRETAELLFDGDALLKAKALKTVIDARPPMVGPSGTPGGIEKFQSLLDPREWIGQVNSLSKDVLQKIVTNPDTAKAVARGLVLSANRKDKGLTPPTDGLQVPGR